MGRENPSNADFVNGSFHKCSSAVNKNNKQTIKKQQQSKKHNKICHLLPEPQSERTYFLGSPSLVKFQNHTMSPMTSYNSNLKAPVKRSGANPGATASKRPRLQPPNQDQKKEESLAEALTKTGQLSSTVASLTCLNANSKQKKLLALSTDLKPNFPKRGKENKPANPKPFRKPFPPQAKAKKPSPPSVPCQPNTPDPSQPHGFGNSFKGYDQFWWKRLDNFHDLFPTGPIQIKKKGTTA